MPKRTDIKSILVIGSGPIVIGQACEFDYSGAQACKVLKADGYRVILVNSNPATIMTDPGLADRTYVEPITPEFVEKVVEKERPDALLPTLGGQTGLNTAVALAKSGVLDKYGVEMVGCDLPAIERGEDRKLFNECMEELGIEVARSGYAYSMEDAESIVAELGFPVVCRPSFTLGGAGGGIAHDTDELHLIVSQGLELSPAGEVLVEESIEGWKEYEMEVMRDRVGNGIIVCSIENFDAMGVHTGDSITVAPAQTLSDVEYQRMRTASLAILEKIGVETGGSNVQFAVNPKTGRMIVIEMNPRVSRSSALASKATGFPIAKAAAKLAVGYTLDEIVNDITKATPACFEPSIDYCVVKVPRFAFEKFQGTDDTLTTRMKAVGEIMSIGRTFEESLGKALRSLENGRAGLGADGKGAESTMQGAEFDDMVCRPTANRIFFIGEAMRRGMSVEELHEKTGIDPWFLARMADMVAVEQALSGHKLEELDEDDMRCAKRFGLSDVQIAHLTGSDELSVRAHRKALGVVPAFKTVDTCAAETPSKTAYHYKTYDTCESEVAPKTKKRAMILGAGPNRIGQGIEFDYCCVHASYALADAGFETIMVNCNPETVSTDYDTSDKLYFEPLTFEDVMDIVDVEDPDGVVVTLGGQTPLKLARCSAGSGRPHYGHEPRGRSTLLKTVTASLRCSTSSRLSTPQRARHLPSKRRIRLPSTSASRCSSVRATCSVVAVWPSSTTTTSLTNTWPKPRRFRPTTRSILTDSSKLPLKSTSMRSATARTCSWAASWSTSRWQASTRATPPAAHRRSRSRSAFRSSCATSHAALRCAWALSACSTFSSPLKIRSST